MRILKLLMALSIVVLGVILFAPEVCAQGDSVEEVIATQENTPNTNEQTEEITKEEFSFEKDKKEESETVDNQEQNSDFEVEDSDEEDESIEAIDTIDLNNPQGNWLIKRFWFNKAEQLYDRMSQQVERIFNLGSDFQQKAAELDQKIFDPFYIDIGIDKGSLENMLDTLLEKIETSADDSVEINEEEQEYLEQLEQEKGTLEQLKADVKGISDIDAAINKALATFNERANLSRNYHNKVWHLFQEIAHELNDKKARELYFTIKSLARSITDIEEYITSPFLQYFDELANKADEQINRIKQEVEALKQKGVDLKLKIDQVEDAKNEETIEQASHRGYEAAVLEQQEREKRERGFFSSIGSMVQSMWNTFYSFLQKLFSSAKKETALVDKEQSKIEESVLDVPSIGLEKQINAQEEEGAQFVEPAVQTKDLELELASDAEQQEAMTAGAEEVELVNSKEEALSLNNNQSTDALEEEASVLEEHLEVQPQDVGELPKVSVQPEREEEQKQ